MSICESWQIVGLAGTSYVNYPEKRPSGSLRRTGSYNLNTKTERYGSTFGTVTRTWKIFLKLGTFLAKRNNTALSGITMPTALTIYKR